MSRRIAAATLALVALLLAPAAAQNGNAAWLSWARANHHPIATIHPTESDTFDDLQFFKTVLKDRRLVQLGESGHGVAEFNHAKVRLIQFLHQQMGFDVLAFESGLFECYNASHTAAANTALATMRNCIFGVWHTNEVLPLFEYIKSTQGTARPLTLAGFDTQMSSSAGVFREPGSRHRSHPRHSCRKHRPRTHHPCAPGDSDVSENGRGTTDRVLWRA